MHMGSMTDAPTSQRVTQSNVGGLPAQEQTASSASSQVHSPSSQVASVAHVVSASGVSQHPGPGPQKSPSQLLSGSQGTPRGTPHDTQPSGMHVEVNI